MKIESIIRRRNGSRIEMSDPNKVYVFRPSSDDPEGPHVTDVTDEGHISRFLRITEGFKPAPGEEMQDKNINALIPDRELNGSTIHRAVYHLKPDNQPVLLIDIINMAFDESGLDENEWNNAEDTIRYAWIDQIIKETTVEGSSLDATTDPLTSLTDTPPSQGSINDDTPNEKNAELARINAMSRAELNDAYKAFMGRNPSHLMKDENVRAALLSHYDED